MSRKQGQPGHDYDGDEFYDSVKKMARAGLTDREIANALGLSASHFSHVKNGTNKDLPEDVRKERSERLKKALRTGRTEVTAVLHATYMNIALGKVFTKQKVRKKQEMPCSCGGGDPNCPECGGTGVVLVEIGVIQENEIQQPPNLQAISTLLNVYDPDWSAGVAESENEAETGIDICKWIEQETSAKAIKEKAEADSESQTNDDNEE